MIRAGTTILALVLGVVSISPVFCQLISDTTTTISATATPRAPINTVKGQISSIDWINRNITVKWMDPYNAEFDEISVFVPRNAKIIQGNHQASFSDLIVMNDVIVDYYDDPADFGPARVVRIAAKRNG